MELQQLRCFLAAAELENFTRGAKRAFVSQPALSASISKLEAEMGVKLFTRNKRNVVLTPAGRMLLKRAKNIMHECARAKDELKHHDMQRVLRLGVINTLSITHVARLIEQYRRQHPHLRLNVFDASEAEMEQLAQAGRIDMALTVLSAATDNGGAFNQSQALFSESYHLAMAADHHLSQLPSVSLTDLQHEPFIARSHCEYRRVFQALLKDSDVRLTVAYVTNQDDRALRLVEEGVGVAFMPEHYTSPGIVKRPLLNAAEQRTIGFTWAAGNNQDEVDQLVAFACTARWP
ncbi:LysR family transcriptional regulator [Amphritea sp. 1_MG-2023]|uniref:LysR family transcriptional regulator n=1 Tax=Amphritea sp. 1_MG-2023 TaxID=3062670 RepID=UPI0026E32411|nr:LysR family transcriptional regulator [Amphritea sp. 1_MG-2023]MDO6562401.1 LysR family transcriptional regulator [Amphritea sp. 1_MG-2023]